MLNSEVEILKTESRIKVALQLITVLKGTEIITEVKEVGSWVEDLQVGIETLRIEPNEENYQSLSHMIRRYRKLALELLDELAPVIQRIE